MISCLPSGATEGSKLDGTTMNALISSGISPRASVSLYSRRTMDEKLLSILISGLTGVSMPKRAMMPTNEMARSST